MNTSSLETRPSRATVVEVDTDIEHAPEEVFDYCSDPLNEREWNPRLRRVEKLTEGPAGLGTRYAMEFIAGHPMVVECVRFERPAAWDLLGQSRPARFAWRGRVAPAGQGAHLALRVEMEAPLLLGFAMPFLARHLRRDLHRDIATIKRILEGRQP